MLSEGTVVAIVGLGYVGLPLAVEFGKRYSTVGFDLSSAKIEAYREYRDPTGEVSREDMQAARGWKSQLIHVISLVPTL